jgi:hypothetical protein
MSKKIINKKNKLNVIEINRYLPKFTKENNLNAIEINRNLPKFTKENDTQNDTRLEYVLNRYKTKLENYKYVQYEQLCNIESKSHISYIKKSNLNIKNGYVKEVKDNSIIELTNHYKKLIWFIYTKDYYIFVRESNTNKFKMALKSLVDSDFSDVREKIKIKKLNTEYC